jgi:predicted SnoaL-like aldol condensation-catalyzing enzyme
MKNLFIFLVVALLAMTACQKADTTAETKAMLQSSIDEIWNQGNLDKAEEFFAATYVRHNPKSMEPNIPSEIEGLEAFKAYVEQVRTIYADFNVKIDAIIIEGDMVATRWTATGTHKDANKPIDVAGATITRLAEGKAVEEWVTWDTYLVMQQLGMVPSVETTEK